ncbi:hypothetical protein [Nostoc commune]|uniref:hypothetical protein n=1 Tax=Nostoc commune TaxID=1178 RepID=UPI0011B238A7|nr:hypothetical protein [Nostoc commune]
MTITTFAKIKCYQSPNDLNSADHKRAIAFKKYLTQSDRTRNRYRLADVGFLVVRGDTNLNNERRTNNDSQI